jgi:hypothetical protein
MLAVTRQTLFPAAVITTASIEAAGSAPPG